MKLSSMCTAGLLIGSASAFAPQTSSTQKASSSSALAMGWFDNWTAGGSGNSQAELDEQWEAQQEILRNRRKPQAERDAYFDKVNQRRAEATAKQQNMWAWQTKTCMYLY